MEKQKYKDEEIKTKIFKTYSKYRDESPDRRQVHYVQLCDLVFRWCRDHLFYKETEEMGVEIVETVKRCAKKEKTPEEFLKYLRTALDNARNQYYRNDIKGSLSETRKMKEIKKLIKMWEINKGEELTANECIIRITEWYCISEKKARKYFENMDRISDFNNNTYNYYDDGKNIIETMTDHSLTMEGTVSNPEVNEEREAEIIKNILETVLNEYPDKMEPFYRALFTVRCIKKNKNYQRLLPILNTEILEMFKQNGKKPAQYEIYMKYHPNAEKSTAEANVSQMSKKFFADLNKAIKEKYQEFNF